MPAPAPLGERGAATSEFAMLAGLVSVILVAAMQLAFALHVHNTATAHVVEGARLGARADSDPQLGAQRARELIAESLPGSRGVAVSSGRTSVSGVEVVEVTATMTLPVFGPFGPADRMSVTGHAYAEDQ
ncbi:MULTISPECIES: TadE/TadG family type IV pilus assembly protein [unclassified Ornithinimicrobium]|uniref:TadE/TadG family type IV pilus assembly protein n=1 Tax=unclassified Ornithinimicrobium TaxID=2615080 RepID=UPI003851FDBA